MNKHQLESLLKKKNYDEIRDFIKQNAKNDEKEPLVDYAIEALNQTGEMENHSFLKELFTKWIEARDYETLNLYITNLETEGNGESVTTFLHSLEDYQEEEETLESQKNELPQLKNRHDELVSNYPGPVPLENPTLIPFSGEILQRINEREYLVIDTYDYEGKEYVLKTSETVFSSTGRFSMQVTLGEKEIYQLKNGFTKEFLVLYEVPAAHVELMQEILELRDQISDTEASIREHEQSIDTSGSFFKGLLDAIFLYRDATNEPIRQTEEQETEEETGESEIIPVEFTVKEDQFYLNEVTLEDTKNSIVNKFGEPESTEEDLLGESEIFYVYQNMDIGFVNEKVNQMNLEITSKEFEEQILNQYSGEVYENEDQDGTVYLYNKQSGHLLMAKYGEGKLFVYFSYADNLFN